MRRRGDKNETASDSHLGFVLRTLFTLKHYHLRPYRSKSGGIDHPRGGVMRRRGDSHLPSRFCHLGFGLLINEEIAL